MKKEIKGFVQRRTEEEWIFIECKNANSVMFDPATLIIDEPETFEEEVKRWMNDNGYHFLSTKNREENVIEIMKEIAERHYKK